MPFSMNDILDIAGDDTQILREGREASKKTALFEGGRRSVCFSCGSITSLEGENHIQSCLFYIVAFANALIMNLIFLLFITVA
jgi:hypothetical protein